MFELADAKGFSKRLYSVFYAMREDPCCTTGGAETSNSQQINGHSQFGSTSSPDFHVNNDQAVSSASRFSTIGYSTTFEQ